MEKILEYLTQVGKRVVDVDLFMIDWDLNMRKRNFVFLLQLNYLFGNIYVCIYVAGSYLAFALHYIY